MKQYGLPARPAEMLAFIKAYIADHQRSPSFQEIADAMGYASKGSVYRVMQMLRERGHVDMIEGRSRSLIVLRDEPAQPSQAAKIAQLENENTRLRGELNVARLENGILRQIVEETRHV